MKMKTDICSRWMDSFEIFQNLPCFCTLACPERFAEIKKKIKNQKSPHGVGIKTVFESQKP